MVSPKYRFLLLIHGGALACGGAAPQERVRHLRFLPQSVDRLTHQLQRRPFAPTCCVLRCRSRFRSFHAPHQLVALSMLRALSPAHQTLNLVPLLGQEAVELEISVGVRQLHEAADVTLDSLQNRLSTLSRIFRLLRAASIGFRLGVAQQCSGEPSMSIRDGHNATRNEAYLALVSFLLPSAMHRQR
ncbi:hypothetical protein DM02DRAFT_335007 [Periconia macrospinosa]|uniref:Secreted protein n=1 Tax=Periconia macrospinosa TaxID=97972 RepID=A0A2V1D2Z9_9PLEO|nr:hypothetical protein DM02DRAFT_335007 [Periconia macrospinosa]